MTIGVQLDLILLSLMIVTAMGAIMARSLIKGAVGLALTSVILAILMFRLQAPLAAVFELSVCAGLITVIFISAISLTQPLAPADQPAQDHLRSKRYLWLPIILMAVAVALAFVWHPVWWPLPPPAAPGVDVKQVLWNQRPLDLFGQVVVLLAGIFGVVVLFKEKKQP